MVACPEIMMTSGAFSMSWIFCRVSRPSIPGSQTSSRTTAKERFRKVSRQASPLSATATLYPSSSSTPLSDCRMPDSSSTMRMLRMLAGGGRGNNFWRDRQFHDKPGADRLILLDTNRAAMVFYDTTDDGQAQPGSPFLGGEVGQKESLF